MLAHKRIKDILVIDGNEEIDLKKMEEIKSIISSLIDEGTYKVVINFKRTQHINYLGIQVLEERLSRLRQFHGDLRLAGMNDYLENIFKVVGADNQFKSFISVKDAVKSFEEEGQH